MIATLQEAADFVDEVGLALLFPKADVVLPSLWEEASGSSAPNWAIRDEHGTFVRWSDELAFLWHAKDALPAAGLVCVGGHLARSVACVAPRVLPLLVAACGEDESGGPVVEAVREHGPLTSPELRQATGLAKKEVEREVARLHHRLVLTSDRLVEGGGGAWGALAHDLVARKWSLPTALPGREEARRELAAFLLARAGELTAADAAGVFCWRRREAAALLEQVGEGRDDAAGFRIWTRR